MLQSRDGIFLQSEVIVQSLVLSGLLVKFILKLLKHQSYLPDFFLSLSCYLVTLRMGLVELQL